jgi:broad specificity phosphatase PhoE
VIRQGRRQGLSPRPIRAEQSTRLNGQVMAPAHKRIILARHGETTANRDGFIMGRSDFSLTPEGALVAEKVGSLIRNENIAYVLSSPLGRAIASSRIYTNGTGLRISTSDSLAELACGQWEGRLRDGVTGGKHAIRDTWFDRPPGGESYNDAEPRAESVIRELASDTNPESVLVVGHAGINRVLLKLLLNLEPEIALRIQCPHDTIYVIKGREVEAKSAAGSKTQGLIFCK